MKIFLKPLGDVRTLGTIHDWIWEIVAVVILAVIWIGSFFL
jgi:hypothetical protein